MSSGTLYRGGTVLTLGSAAPRAAALATRGDRIVAIGAEAQCRAALRSAGVHQVEEVNLGGACLLPGFIDTHLHPIGLLYFDMHADLRGVDSIAAVQDRLRDAAARLQDDEWLVGLQLEDADLAERRLPTRRELDAACGTHPVVVMKHDGHSACGNSRALAAAGIDASTADPPGGHIERDADGAPNGVCREAAAQRLFGAVPTPGLARLTATADRTFARLAAHGITAIGAILQTDEEGPGGASGRLESMAMQVLLAQAPFSIYSILIGRTVEAAVAARDSALHDPTAGHRVGGFKIFSDGTFGSCTACMHEPFSDRPDARGYMTLGEDEILARMRAAHTAGLQICVHAIGDAAVERCVGLFEQLLAEQPRPDHRHRLEHASLVAPALVPRLRKLGLVVSTQPLFIHSEKHWLHRRLGAERARYTYPLRSLVEAGVVVAGASDAPVESTDVLHAIQCCVTREGFETHEALTPEQALRLFTRDAAYAQFAEREMGTLAPGKRADLVVLSADPLRVAPERIAALRVLRTICGGRVTHDAGGLR
jgi:predicted amidohydrolase YtcJ